MQSTSLSASYVYIAAKRRATKRRVAGTGSYTELFKAPREYDLEPNRENHLDLDPNPSRIPYGSYPGSQDNRDLIRNQIIHMLGGSDACIS